MMKTGSEDEGLKITREITALMISLRSLRGLPLDDPQVVAVMAEKRRLLAVVEAARGDGWVTPA